MFKMAFAILCCGFATSASAQENNNVYANVVPFMDTPTPVPTDEQYPTPHPTHEPTEYPTLPTHSPTHHPTARGGGFSLDDATSLGAGDVAAIVIFGLLGSMMAVGAAVFAVRKCRKATPADSTKAFELVSADGAALLPSTADAASVRYGTSDHA